MMLLPLPAVQRYAVSLSSHQHASARTVYIAQHVMSRFDTILSPSTRIPSPDHAQIIELLMYPKACLTAWKLRRTCDNPHS